MKLRRQDIIQLASEGYLTLQIPLIHIGISQEDYNRDCEDFDDDLFCYLKGDKTPSIGKQLGFMYLTEKGFNFFKMDLKKSFKPNRGSWADFVKSANNHFKHVENKKQKLIKNLKDKLKELESM